MLRELLARLTKMGVRQTALVLLITGVVVAGAGFGFVGTLTDGADEQTATPTTTPAPPDPTVTTQPTATTTATESTATTDASDADEAALDPETATTTTPETTTAPDPVAPNATLALSASDPPTVRNDDGAVERIAGNLTGALDWTAGANVTRVALVVQTWTPDSEWRESRRVEVEPNGSSLAVEAALGGTELVYAEGDRASEFDVDEDGANVSREGFVSVTGVLFDANGTELDRVSTVDGYAVRVINEEAPTVYAFGGSDGEPSVRLGDGEAAPAVLDVAGVAPGYSGEGRLAITNDGDDEGVLRASITAIAERENGLTEPERAVDDSPSSGELAAALDVRISLEDESGETVAYLAGDDSSYVALGSQSPEQLSARTRLDARETVDLVAEWRVDADVGNEIQSDSVSFDFNATVVDDASALQDAGAPTAPTDLVGKSDIITRPRDMTGGTA
ncbi:hypothetical protein [Halorussus marinus]|uniref:hypothetical protein n=1 Tax=Halorussus marinus TaxID=2505976 RepID=UPI00109283DC|nr:hypothetical protein [Halorussus marinus]